MTNEEKAREIAERHHEIYDDYYDSMQECIDSALEMARWKDEQQVDGSETLKEMKEKLEYHLSMSKKMSDLINNVLNTINNK